MRENLQTMILPVIGALIGGQITVTRTGKLRKDIRENINLLGQLPGGSPTNNVDNLDADHDAPIADGSAVGRLGPPLAHDADHDGQACEDFDYGATGGGGTGGGGTGGDDGELPFTGPNDTLLPAGTALLVAGLALVGVTRYRARHARR